MRPGDRPSVDSCARQLRSRLTGDTHARADRRGVPEWPRNRGPTPRPRRR